MSICCWRFLQLGRGKVERLVLRAIVKARVLHLGWHRPQGIGGSIQYSFGSGALNNERLPVQSLVFQLMVEHVQAGVASTYLITKTVQELVHKLLRTKPYERIFRCA